MAFGLEQSLKIVVSAVDQASGTLREITRTVEDMQSKTLLSADALDSAGRSAQRLGRDLTTYVTLPTTERV